jgi:hypothetical protein
MILDVEDGTRPNGVKPTLYLPTFINLLQVRLELQIAYHFGLIKHQEILIFLVLIVWISFQFQVIMVLFHSIIIQMMGTFQIT